MRLSQCDSAVWSRGFTCIVVMAHHITDFHYLGGKLRSAAPVSKILKPCGFHAVRLATEDPTS